MPRPLRGQTWNVAARGVVFSRDEVAAFRRRWPASGLPQRWIRFEFDARGDLVDVKPSLERADQAAVAALVADARALLVGRGALSNPRGGRRRLRAGTRVRFTGPSWLGPPTGSLGTVALVRGARGGLSTTPDPSGLMTFVQWDNRQAEGVYTAQLEILRDNPLPDKPGDFSVGDVVRISAIRYFGRYGTVVAVGRKTVTVLVHLTNRRVKFLPGHLQLANPHRRSSRKPRRRRPARARGRIRNPRAPLEPGELVRVPYVGTSKRRVTERATVLGLVPEGVHVLVRKGKRSEERTVPEDRVRRAAARGERGAKARIARVKGRLELKSLRERQRATRAALKKARDAYDCAEAKAKQLQPYAGEKPSAEYRAERAKLNRVQLELEALQKILTELERADPKRALEPDPFALPNRARAARGRPGRRKLPRGPANPGRPAGSELERAQRTFRRWHEFDPGTVRKLRGPARRIPRTLVALGEIPEFIYRSHKWEGRPRTYVHRTGRPRPVLATDPDGSSLYIVGGNVRVTADGLVG